MYKYRWQDRFEMHLPANTETELETIEYDLWTAPTYQELCIPNKTDGVGSMNCHRAGTKVEVQNDDATGTWGDLPDSCIVPVAPPPSPCTQAYKLGQKITDVFVRVTHDKVYQWEANAQISKAGFKDDSAN